MTLDTERIRWKPKNSNAACAGTLAAAGYEVGSYLVSAESARLDGFTRLKDRYSALAFQERFWLGRLRSSIWRA